MRSSSWPSLDDKHLHALIARSLTQSWRMQLGTSLPAASLGRERVGCF